ncbi:nose resistant to fluoxetine protein 6-like, partial [Papilio machaon]|uniref:nose resistant to fluoxetine protein 6-like n=1 Tax=Papilio machaon TaxID=76193 RepID=UPI001E664C30
MPPVFNFDRYEICVNQKDGIYCTINIDLVTDEENDLFNIIQEYSERKETHYNHTRLFHGVCVSKMCSDYLKKNSSEDFKLVVERCLNDTYWKNYKLKTKLHDNIICNYNNKQMDKKFDLFDVAFAMFCLFLILFNLIGSVYDFFIKGNEENKWLLCFSVKQNWRRLTAPTRNGSKRRVTRLFGLNGMRLISTFMMIVVHSILPFVIAGDNTKKVEDAYNSILYHILFDGTILVQTFFVISGCLLAYNLEMFTVKEKLNWKIIFKRTFARWQRFTPPYVIVLAFTMTLARFAGSGPLWHKIVHSEVQDCRRDGWLNMLYVNNYIDRSQCMMHTWYLAADIHLSILGLITLVVAKSNRARIVMLSFLFSISLVIPALQTYYQDLYAYFTITPEFVRALFRNDPTFNAYRRTHTNISCYITGLSLGLLISKLQKKKMNTKISAKYKYLYWAIVPIGIAVILTSGIFYMDGMVAPLIYKAIHSSTLRAVAGILLSAIILGMVLRIEDTYRGILEWRGWTTPERLCYSAYLLHLIVIQILTGTRTTLIYITEFQIEYSERKETHYNHTRLFHGVCVSKMCSEYLKKNSSEDFKIIVEKCLNDSYWKNYKLKTK